MTLLLGELEKLGKTLGHPIIGAAPWVYRPNTFDDWGTVRDSSGYPVIRVREHKGACLDLYRTADEDPCEDTGRMVVAAVNNFPALLTMARRSLRLEAENEKLREVLLNVMGHVDTTIARRQLNSSDFERLQDARNILKGG